MPAAEAGRHARRRRGLLLAGVALLVFGARCAWVSAAGSNLPLWDQWHGLPVLDALAHGELGALAVPHNEHRLLTTRLVSTTLMLLSGYWDVKGELVVSAAVNAAEVALLATLLLPLVGRARLPGLLLLLVATRALPLSPFNLLSGFQVQFALAEIFSVVGLAVATTRRPLDAEGAAASTAAFLLAFFSMATGLLAVGAALGVLLLQALAARRLAPPRAAFALLLLCLLGCFYLLTPYLAVYAPRGALQPLRPLLACLSFPLEGAWPWALLVHGPLLLLALRLVRQARPDDPDWLVVGLGLWTLALSGALAVGRGALEEVPAVRHVEFLALPLVWTYVALVRLLERDGGDAGPGGRWRSLLPAAWAVSATLALAGYTWARPWPLLTELRRTVPAAEASFRRSVASGDWGQQDLQRAYVAGWLAARDASFLNHPTYRFTIPDTSALAAARGPRRLLPPPLVSGGAAAAPARLLERTAAAWPWWLAAGGVLLVVGARRRAGAPPG